MIIELTGARKAAALPLFSRSPHHQIARSCCLSLNESRIFADDMTRPTAAVAVLARFGIGFAAGDARHAPELLDALRGWHPWYEISDPPASWHPALAAWSRKSHATVRYGFSASPTAFDREALHALATPPEGCQIVHYDRAMLEQALSIQWSEDQIGAFPSIDSFLRNGLGIALVHDGSLVSGCVSFCRHPSGYEIQIDTHPDHRGKGYARCVGAAFVLECLRLGQRPAWDAANLTSLRLAERLGFVFTEAYSAWILVPPDTDTAAVLQQVVGPDAT